MLNMPPDQKWLAGYEGYYTISTAGKVYRFIKGRFREKSLYADKYGYHTVSLYKPGSRAKIGKVARLVAQAFLKDFYLKPQVNHKNKIRSDNRIDNLEMVTALENIQHSWKTGRQGLKGEQQKRGVLNDSLVREIRCLYQKGVSQREIARRVLIDYRHVFKVVHNKIWTHVI